jgi:outer membrane murein-binding lipoprotein Lpp
MKKMMMIFAVLGLTMLTGCGHSTHSHAKNDKACTECKGHTAKTGCTDCGDKTASAGCPDCKTAATK